MNIAALDLNLLLAFEALLVERSVSRAAARIGLSQPGMSNALARLRAVFDDRLFSRRGRALAPTAKAVALARPVCEALALIRNAISDRAEFEPATAGLRFRILASDYCEMAVVAPFLRGLRANARGIEVHVHRPTDLFRLPLDELAADLVDVAIGFFPELLPPGSGLVQTRLTEERMVCLVRKNPAGQRRLTLKQFAETPQIRVSFSRDMPGLMDEILASHGYKRVVPVVCSGFLNVPWLLEGTDLLGIVPEKLALAVAERFKLRIVQLPVTLPPMRLSLVWHERNTSHPGHRWLRLQLIQASRDLQKPVKQAPKQVLKHSHRILSQSKPVEGI